MKQSICEIFLNANGHCDGVYHSGQKLSGYVLLTFYEKQKINSESRLLFVSTSTFNSTLLNFFGGKNDEFEKNLVHTIVCLFKNKKRIAMFIFLLKLLIAFAHLAFCLLFTFFQILRCKFLASVNVSGVNNAEPIKVKRFTWKMKFKLPKQNKVSGNVQW